MTCFVYSRKFKIEKPPQVVLPDPSDQPWFYADVSVQYPLSEEVIPLHLDYKMFFELELYLILGERGGAPPIEQTLLADAFIMKRKLDRWLARVGAVFEPKALAFPIHFGL